MNWTIFFGACATYSILLKGCLFELNVGGKLNLDSESEAGTYRADRTRLVFVGLSAGLLSNMALTRLKLKSILPFAICRWEKFRSSIYA